MSQVSPLIPHLVVSNAASAIDFYKQAFGAVELARHLVPNSSLIMHAHLIINDGHLMLNDDFSTTMGSKSETPEALGGSPVILHLQVEDADSVWNTAVAAGATVVLPLADQFWGDRYGQLRDPFGHKWSIGQTKQKLTQAEIEEASKAAFQAES
jgi:PhnB protein